MRREFGVGVVCLLLASCGSGQNDSHPSAAAARAPQRMEHFWFSYPYEPLPGSRVWINLAHTNWVEVYPNGSQSRYQLLGPETVDGLAGIVVIKAAGDLEATRTLNDGSFQAFIPDKTNSRSVLYFRNRIAGQWQPWKPLAQINPIE